MVPTNTHLKYVFNADGAPPGPYCRPWSTARLNTSVHNNKSTSGSTKINFAMCFYPSGNGTGRVGRSEVTLGSTVASSSYVFLLDQDLRHLIPAFSGTATVCAIPWLCMHSCLDGDEVVGMLFNIAPFFFASWLVSACSHMWCGLWQFLHFYAVEHLLAKYEMYRSFALSVILAWCSWMLELANQHTSIVQDTVEHTWLLQNVTTNQTSYSALTLVWQWQ